jgi:hypothetical protein
MKIPKTRPVEDSGVLSQQAERLSGRLLTIREAEVLGTEENPLKEAARALRGDSVQSISAPLSIRPGAMADPAPLNRFFKKVKDDLEVVAKTGVVLADLAVASHNTVMTKRNDIVGELKTLRDRIATLKLYSTDITDSDQYIAYTFTDGSQIGVPEGSSVATYGEEEGVLTLPVDSVVQPAIESIKIVEGSNGLVGNNFDSTRLRHGFVGSVSDNEPLTWFEYEKIARRGETLRLILRFNFAEESVVNRVVIDPINFGTANWMRVEDIEVQTGSLFKSVQADITSPTWDPNSDPFKLTAGSSKFAGKGVYTFKPISEGEFLLTESKFNTAVRAIGVTDNLAPYDPKFASVEYSISTDSGETWTDIVGKENKDSAKLEALVLANPSDLVIVKGKFERLHEGFVGEINENEDDGLFSESKVFPSSSISAPISLVGEPQSYLEVIQMRMGSMGDYGPKYFLGKSTGVIGAAQVFPMPIELDKSDITLLVNEEPWSRVSAFPSATSKTFIYDTTGVFPVVITGDGLDDDGALGGAVPPSGASLYLKVKALQNPQVDAIPSGYRLNLIYGASKILDSTRVIFNDLRTYDSTSVAGPGSNYIEIPWERDKVQLTSLATTAVDWVAQGNSVIFENGETEFDGLAAGFYWSIDHDRGRIYISPALGVEDGDIEAGYRHLLRVLIPTDQWKYADNVNAIDVRSPLITPRLVKKNIGQVVPGRVMELDDVFIWEDRSFSIMKGTVRGENFNRMPAGEKGAADALKTEIDYVNGSAEFDRVRAEVGSQHLFGFFSVNYVENTIHLPPSTFIDDDDKGFLRGDIVWEYISSEVHYGLGVKLMEDSEYVAAGRLVETTPFFMEKLEDDRRRLGRSFDFHIRYNLIGAKSVEGSVLEDFYSPVLRDLALVGIRIDPRLGTLENL